jgi:tripartite-type tricarboxylate transporter receptor subunit TctC
MRPSFRLCLAVLLAAATGAHAAQRAPSEDSSAGYPVRPIRLIVPFPPGGSNDIMGRYLGQYLTERLGRPVVVDNRGGGEGIIGTEIVARSQPDGYTLLLISAAHSVSAATRKLNYDPIESFAWVGTLGMGPSLLSAGPALQVNSVRDLLAYGKANPGKLTLGTSAGYAHFSAELFHHLSGVKMLVVVYKGGGPALIDLMGGQVHINLGTLIQAIPHMRSGKLKPLATSGAKRSPATPDLPTIAEAGVPGYEANNWWAIGAPARTPQVVISRLSGEITRYLTLPETQKRFESEGIEALLSTPEEIRRKLPVEIAKWAKVAKMANISPQ